ncbi:hypothetical protein G6F26_009284 [Rhizopus arrhizus]|nr:hypothetical protein G6F22_010479 [Rhizopus arrhizus]KAG0829906.1 hypothetical protein G6F18_008402 [Rhizopus arrhizus]KAG0946210.1 hypothetical protein G6F32_006663 [Rhizopus arrhizus]KAG1005118.1 hypothetical protein G6F27_009518 [Rhizopus arrhizus]KAG1020453.1 hypothetical protein G6F26_009284 [Rhizopus arrhizus]
MYIFTLYIKGDQQQQQPIFIYRNNSNNNNNNSNNKQTQCLTHSNSDTTQGSLCTCSSAMDAPMVRASSEGQPSLSLNNLKELVQESSIPILPYTTPLAIKEETPYSWALVTSPSLNHAELPHASISSTAAAQKNKENTNLHLGFIFQKPPSANRILDGQPRVCRRRSTKKNPNSCCSTPTRSLNANANYDTIMNVDSFTGLSTPPPSSSVSSSEPVDMQFDYLTQQLKVLSNHENNQKLMDEGLANAEELTAILNNVFHKEDESSMVNSMLQDNQILATVPNNLSPLSHAPPLVNAHPQQSPAGTPNINRSHCGSFVPSSNCYRPAGSSGGESVVITITPLVTHNKEEHQRQQEYHSTTTRIVTCYCGSSCTCPGCLVHPGNFFLGSDPYSGPLVNASSSASSSYGSDDEDISSIYSNHNNVDFSF